ncbi:hypothetical protein J1614_009312 [Plenodomus biglobosus]|nr:hypothetical protein J1614_009312 [Plenodomus biglobosus]
MHGCGGGVGGRQILLASYGITATPTDASWKGRLDKVRDDNTHYRPQKAEESQWPPRFWKFLLEMKESPPETVAFVDPKRLARIRLVNVAGENMRETTVLKKNGPDPVIDKDILTVCWLKRKLQFHRVPVKALLLD